MHTFASIYFTANTSESAELLLYIHTVRIWAAMGTRLV